MPDFRFIFTHNAFKKTLKGILLLIILLVLIFFLFRNSLLRQVFNSKAESFQSRYHASLQVKDLSFTGIAGLHIKGLTLVPDSLDTLLVMNEATIHLSLSNLLIFRIKPASLESDGLKITFVRKDSATNYMFLLRTKTTQTDTNRIQSPINFGLQADRLFSLLFQKIPDKAVFKNLVIAASLDKNRFSFSAPDYNVTGKSFTNTIFITNHDSITPVVIEGEIDRSARSGKFRIYTSTGQKIQLPYIDWKWDTRLRFDTLLFSLQVNDFDDDKLQLNGKASITGLSINQPRISDKTVEFEQLSTDYRFNLYPNAIELDSTGSVTINKLSINPYIRIKPYPVPEAEIVINKPWFDSQLLFSSLPKGLFYNLQGMKTKGELNYNLHFKAKWDSLDSLTFISEMGSRKFRIEQFGNTFPGFINTSFQHTAFEKGVAVRTFEVGPGNSSFRSLNLIPPFLRNAIMTSEDGGFFYHRGFLPDAIRDALILDLKEGRFARGGSTISMQLVKNVFLNRNKTITRKLEEILLTWLIENCRLSTKERMYEVYLNIIEMGPMVYGVEEGSRFYFGKDVSKLSLAESVFIASIVPRPKKFMYSFDPSGNLKPYLTEYYKLMAIKMLAKGFITEAEAAGLTPNVKLTGPALKMLIHNDTIPQDSITVELPYIGN
jgi:hypothetical protein